MALTFITGGVRSGKSRLARSIAERHDGPVTYVATARGDANDPEFAERIRRHRSERPAHWETIETAGETEIDLAAELARRGARELLLIDSLGTWLAADMREGVTLADLLARSDVLLAALRTCACDVVVVSEETGWGIVPEHRSGRLFRDALGLVNQQMAHMAGTAYLAVSGYALDLKAGIAIR